ncbi:Hsp20/alpha crystallin family protein [Pediococcus acidilactici]|uniref:Hsp20/alpha crystallin family protein n=1 Tax=Pediococcus acidilactici TaxID=1254 RepID=UPI00132266C2|nr:Hsp20/alpha crystallin family protein [Pediococcus acidilactici]KAF0336616.1 Hsp20 family protein [Pediococcus acidilactici]KAF0337350.1 Hsp20 family protein [Pediococcus acidilactici]KAF0340093.1 Hsp20 family protein [Pediococcus acidilactici]KAF0345520.1 Hsp20 family protein [Pediococcus acidilactici]KAF0349227.1 Hsp20 family protein [Pediococcus acidilactici]
MANEMMNRRNDMWDPFFDRLARGFFNDSWNATPTSLKTDVSESDKDYNVKIDVPGIDKKDIKLNYQDGVLNVEVKKDSFADHEDKEHNVTMTERNYGIMHRSYSLPGVKGSDIKAKVDNGVLSITLPKTNDDSSSGIEIE